MMAGAALTIERLRTQGERFMEELSREYYESLAGLKSEAHLRPIYERHAAINGPEALELVVDMLRSAPAGSEDERASRLLTEWLAESQSARALAPLDERQIAWEGQAVVQLADGRQLPFQRASIEMANTVDRRERLAIESARNVLVERELAPLRRERLDRERELTEKLGLAANYIATFEKLSGVSVASLRAECETFLRDTEPIWREVYPDFVRKGLGIEPREATRSDALALFRAREFDAHFPGNVLEATVRRQVSEMGIDPLADGRVRLDTEEREGKRSRAFCSPVRVPAEVYLVLRPQGGQGDWTTFLHELGHALHFAYMRPDLPMEYRWLGDNSITEAYAMLFDHRMQDGAWLARYSELGQSRISGFLRKAGFEELHFLRRYCAKLMYETELYGGEQSWDALPDRYVEQLTSATTFRYARADAFVDVDPRFYAARYLRAWQLQALLNETLTEQFDEDWWRNPRAGPWIVHSLFGEGQRELAQEQAFRVSGRELSFAPLVRSIERKLQ
jgi:hypothetical protein